MAVYLATCYKSSKRVLKSFAARPQVNLMSVRYRPMRLKDICTCVEHLAKHPILGPCYGKLIEQLPCAIRRALSYDYMVFNVFEEFQGPKTRFLGAGLAVFVNDDFLRAAKTTPSFWIGPELVKRITGGPSPLLSDAEVRDGNSIEGLNLIVWHNTCWPQDLTRPDLGSATMTAFLETYRGFRLREVFAQASSLEQLRGAQGAGGFYFDRLKGCYGKFPELDASSFSDEPRNFGITRELASTQIVSWVGSLFLYDPPRCGFSQSEQRLLLSALARGTTDEELSRGLRISISGVKRKWRSIYDRVAACLPELVTSNSQGAVDSQGRGKQKKQHLLVYLREHPEELRPVSRRLLPRNDRA